jgi:uncharacterized RDD family membrane protein YckC
MLRDSNQLETRIAVITPENIAFHYRLAGPFRRLPAYAIDLALRAAISFSAAVLCEIALGNSLGLGLTLVTWFVVSWFYHGLFETLWNGQTPGKRLCGLRVQASDGRPVEAWQAVLRNVLREADSLPVFLVPGEVRVAIPLFLVGLVAMAMNRRFQRLGDLACGTIVVAEEPGLFRGLANVHDPAVLELAGQIPPHFRVQRSLAQALSAYVDRRGLFGAAHRAELARSLGEPLCARLDLPRQTSHDLLLGALYYRAFVADRGDEARSRAALDTSPLSLPSG